MTKYRGSASVCMVCKDPLGPKQQRVKVGEKANGVAREIHDRPKCRRRWEQQRVAITATWPENRRALPAGPRELPEPEFKLVGTTDTGDRLELEFTQTRKDDGSYVLTPTEPLPVHVRGMHVETTMPSTTFTAHVDNVSPLLLEVLEDVGQIESARWNRLSIREGMRIDSLAMDRPVMDHVGGTIGRVTEARVVTDAQGNDAVHATITGGEALRHAVEGNNMASLLAESPKHTPRTYQFKPELDSFLSKFYMDRSWRYGDTSRVRAVVEHANPDLLIDMVGRLIPDHALASRIQKVLREKDRWLPAVHKTDDEQSARLVKDNAAMHACVEMGAKLSRTVWELVHAEDLATLETLYDLVKQAVDERR